MTALKIINNQNINLSDEEFEYFKHLCTQYKTSESDGSIFFKDLFDVDKNGFITIVHPKTSIPWSIIHFMQQVQISQRLRFYSEQFILIKKEISVIKNQINDIKTKGVS